MGLLAMGAGACSLTAEEEAGLEAGMAEFGREFHAIRLEHVPTRSVFELQVMVHWCLKGAGGGALFGGGSGCGCGTGGRVLLPRALAAWMLALAAVY